MDMLAPQDPLDVRIWNGTPISRRTTDGYVNATAMCKANGKQWSKYGESERCETYLDALCTETEFGCLTCVES
jgi:formylmethanofuran dehydrogenase subunit D